MGKPKLTIAVALLALAALATMMTFTGYLVIGVLAEFLDTSRFVAGLLLGCVFARFPWIRNGKPRIVGLLPKQLRLPLMATLLSFCLVHFFMQSDVSAALCIGLTIAFVSGFSWLKKMLFARMSSSVFNFAARRNAPVAVDNTVIEGEFKEMKD
jgi:hypothetical protein